eukprot:771633_1
MKGSSESAGSDVSIQSPRDLTPRVKLSGNSSKSMLTFHRIQCALKLIGALQQSVEMAARTALARANASDTDEEQDRPVTDMKEETLWPPIDVQTSFAQSKCDDFQHALQSGTVSLGRLSDNRTILEMLRVCARVGLRPRLGALFPEFAARQGCLSPDPARVEEGGAWWDFALRESGSPPSALRAIRREFVLRATVISVDAACQLAVVLGFDPELIRAETARRLFEQFTDFDRAPHIYALLADSSAPVALGVMLLPVARARLRAVYDSMISRPTFQKIQSQLPADLSVWLAKGKEEYLKAMRSRREQFQHWPGSARRRALAQMYAGAPIALKLQRALLLLVRTQELLVRGISKREHPNNPRAISSSAVKLALGELAHLIELGKFLKRELG